jgi:hypothetical protein
MKTLKTKKKMERKKILLKIKEKFVIKMKIRKK